MNLYKLYWKTTHFLVINANLASDNPSYFRKNHLEEIKKLVMPIDDEVSDEKLQYDINREAAKISAFWSAKSDK